MIDPARYDPVSLPRRRAVAALGAGTLGALLGGCAAALPPRPVDRARAPRVGDTWRYAYRSGWRQDAPRMVDYAIVSVTDQGIGDRLTLDGAASPSADHLFGSGFALVERPFPGLVVRDFSPYLEAFGPPGPGTFAVAMPPAQFGTAWSGTARVVGTEQVITAAGRFAATRVQLDGSRPFVGMDDAADPVRIFATAWYAPAVKRIIKLDFLSQAQRLNPLARDHYELASYRVA
ncbi:MAG: hypothetical protein U1F45_03565 [Burkholderiales bacterium]